MNNNSLFSSKNIKTVIIIAIFFIIASLGLSLAQRPRYQSSVRLLTVFNQSNIDPYTASRTSEYITSVLGEVIYSNSFIDNVFQTNYPIKDNLGTTQEKRAKNWKKMVRVQIQETKGIIDIDILHENRDQAYQFAQAITHTLVTKNQLYHGFGDRVSIKIINTPVTSIGWAEPKLIRNGFLGLGAGLIVGLTFIVLFPEQDIFKLTRFETPRQKKVAVAQSQNDEEIVATNEQAQELLHQYSFYTPQPVMEPVETESVIEETTSDDNSSANQFYRW